MPLLDFIGQRYHHISRYNEIISVLLKYGFEDVVSYLDTHKNIGFLKKLIPHKKLEHAIALTKWEKMRLVCEELGPTFIKFGQLLSNRPDLLPPDLIQELTKLQDAVPPFSNAEVHMALLHELNGPVESLFAEFSDTPFASASMAQVHKAKLLSGEDVVVKVQRPGIAKSIQSDIHIMKNLAEILEKNIPELKYFDPVGLVEKFEESIIQELNFVHEAINLQRFRTNFHEDQEITAPKVYRELSSEKIITLEFFDGIKISHTSELRANGADTKLLAKRVINSFFKQVFSHGFFHDPHPGNMLVLKDDIVGYLDFGMMGNIMQKDLESVGSIIFAIQSGDYKKIIRALQQLSADIRIKNEKQFEYDLFEFVNSYAVSDPTEQEISTMLLQLKDIIIDHELKVPSEFFLLTRALVTIEGISRQLDPQMDILTELKPYLVTLLRRKVNPVRFFRNLFSSAYDFGSHLEDIPLDIRQAIQQFKSGEVKVDLEHKGMDPLIHTVRVISRQLVAAIIIASLVLGTTVIIWADLPPKWGSVPVLAIVGIVFSIIIGIGLLISLNKEKRYK